ncbi:hypothetical protein [Mycolicibacterium hippocampi]|uniref:hypothetical protein n=1 Tax=Mycolicibacterium hippocampi TaxID=659824 RepID=UPI003516B03F
MTENDANLMHRVKTLIETAIASLDPADREQRIAWCVEHDQHGTTMHPAGDGLLEFRWAGRSLVLVSAAALDSEKPLRVEFVNDEIPDGVPEEWSDQ